MKKSFFTIMLLMIVVLVSGCMQPAEATTDQSTDIEQVIQTDSLDTLSATDIVPANPAPQNTAHVPVLAGDMDYQVITIQAPVNHTRYFYSGFRMDMPRSNLRA